MSGHSHWSSIKHKKAAQDKKRAKIFSKLSRRIAVAAREKGPDPKKNSQLRAAIEKARSCDMPKTNIERAIKRGTGELEGVELKTVLFGVYGPGGVAVLIEGVTDNKNRTLTEIKQILKRNSAKLAETDSVKWLFEKKGTITINKEDESEQELELKAIEAGAEDIASQDGTLEIYTKLEDLEQVKQNLKPIEIESTSIGWVPKKIVEVDQEKRRKIEKLVGELNENDAVQEIYSNLASSSAS